MTGFLVATAFLSFLTYAVVYVISLELKLSEERIQQKLKAKQKAKGQS